MQQRFGFRRQVEVAAFLHQREIGDKRGAGGDMLAQQSIFVGGAV